MNCAAWLLDKAQLIMTVSFSRDFRVWMARIIECRNPLLWLSAINHDRQRLQLLRFISQQPAGTLAGYLREIEEDSKFIEDIRAKFSQWTDYKPRATDFMLIRNWGSVLFNEVTLYAIVRAKRPQVMIETGGTPGKSTAFILRAMERNNTGLLYTIDLPPAMNSATRLSKHVMWHESLPAGAVSGWVVPDYLRARHTTLIGKSSDRLPPLLQMLGSLDIFLHDSDHSYENMMWEFETSLPKMASDGLILSDDVMDNTSFFDFCRKHNLDNTHVFNLGAACINKNSKPLNRKA